MSYDPPPSLPVTPTAQNAVAHLQRERGVLRAVLLAAIAKIGLTDEQDVSVEPVEVVAERKVKVR